MKWFLKMRPLVGPLLLLIIALGPWSLIEAQTPAQLAVVPVGTAQLRPLVEVRLLQTRTQT
jgi:hypothetical protein